MNLHHKQFLTKSNQNLIKTYTVQASNESNAAFIQLLNIPWKLAHLCIGHWTYRTVNTVCKKLNSHNQKSFKSQDLFLSSIGCVSHLVLWFVHFSAKWVRAKLTSTSQLHLFSTGTMFSLWWSMTTTVYSHFRWWQVYTMLSIKY